MHEEDEEDPNVAGSVAAQEQILKKTSKSVEIDSTAEGPPAPLQVSTWPHPTPDLECFSGEDKVAIIKSFTKKSFLSPQWDIYVAKMEGGKVGDFQGIIKNVDLVSTKSKAEMDVDE
ncbi:hypothetical protein U1Q18_050928 [Sarracenia purpurea var. burkii]